MRQSLFAFQVLAGAACGLGPYDVPAGDSSGLTGLGPRVENTLGIPLDPTATTAVPDAESGSEGDGASSGDAPSSEVTGPSFDLGTPPTFDDPLPAGCTARKVDFLFIVSRAYWIEDEQPQYLAALPAFMETIETRFAGYDKHILVANPDADWGHSVCDAEGGCIDGVCKWASGYPCGAVEETTDCDWEIGAGVVFPAGHGASNHPCPLVAGRRYIVEEHPQKLAAFKCMARLGLSGNKPRPGDTLVAALAPELNDVSGCNAGFLRDDALLVITIISDAEDYSETSLEDWYDALVEARGGDLRSVALLGLISDAGQLGGKCPYIYEEWIPKTRPLLELVPGSVYGSCCEPDYLPFFEQATDIVLEACTFNYGPE